VRFLRFLLTPGTDVLNGLDRCLTRGFRSMILVFAGTLAGWWIYVPVHELLHAAGCAATGGRVSRLEISAMYGGGPLARIFPFVVSGSEYAGRLSGFDTRGNDWTYLATDLAPFLLTLFPGVWLMRRAAADRRPLLFGLALPVALAPFLSLTGDAYEIGSIAVTHLPPWARQEVLRGDDLALKVSELGRMPQGAPWAGLALAALLGLLWAFLTWWAADAVARRLGQPPVRS
jgi:hypothetical protein